MFSDSCLKKSIDTEELYKKLLMTVPEIIILTDNRGNIEFINENVFPLINYSPKEPIHGRNILSFIKKEDYKKALKNYVSRFYNNTGIQEYKIEFKDGVVMDVEVNGSLLISNDNEALGMVYVIRDITEKKIADKNLKGSEEQYRLLFESANDAIFLMHNDKFIKCNKKTLDIFGCKEEEIIGKSPYKFSPEFQSDGRNSKEKALEKINLVLNGEPQFFEWEHIKADGTIFCAEISLNKLEIKEDVFIQAIVRDISNQKIIMNELFDAKLRAEESDKLKTSFLQNMSHEIRTPLNGITGFCHLLKDIDHLTQDEIKLYIDIIEKASDRLLGIINDVMDISRIDSGFANLALSQISILDIFSYLQNIFSKKIMSKGLIFRKILPEEIAVMNIVTDVDKMYQILSNFINNSIKFTESGEIELSVTLDHEYLSINIKDTGIGIPQEYQEKIFERFWQYEALSNEKYGGTGLGLAISKELAELMGLQIKLYSIPSDGATFSLLFPKNKLQNVQKENIFLNNY